MFRTIEECDVLLVQTMGDDSMPATAARVSFGKDELHSEVTAKDKKLINYLADHEHNSCFEHQTATFIVECPLFIRSQIHRHRAFSYNEISRRYTEENINFWKPTTWREQSDDNKQASTDGVVPEECISFHIPGGKEFNYESMIELIQDWYDNLLFMGVAREQARAVLPQSLLTRFYMTGSLRNFAHYFKLRLDEHAQYEARVIAQKQLDLLQKVWPVSIEALMK